MVRGARARPAVAPNAGAVPGPRVGDHAAADPGGPRHPEVPRVPQALPDAPEPRRRARVRGERAFWDLAEVLVPRGRAYDFNQALMDFGATWCTPRKPKCAPCVMKDTCRSYPSFVAGAARPMR